MTEDEAEPPAEIHRSMIELRDDGKVFTAPPTMVGVPLEKIYPGHPYWDPSWASIEGSGSSRHWTNGSPSTRSIC